VRVLLVGAEGESSGNMEGSHIGHNCGRVESRKEGREYGESRKEGRLYLSFFCFRAAVNFLH
jgi:hypothetical protein